jgi:hypothetical protein
MSDAVSMCLLVQLRRLVNDGCIAYGNLSVIISSEFFVPRYRNDIPDIRKHPSSPAFLIHGLPRGCFENMKTTLGL